MTVASVLTSVKKTIWRCWIVCEEFPTFGAFYGGDYFRVFRLETRDVYEYKGVQFFLVKKGNNWESYEVSTTARLGLSFKTRKEAIDYAVKKIDEHEKEMPEIIQTCFYRQFLPIKYENLVTWLIL